jgi:hypothetical protein
MIHAVEAVLQSALKVKEEGAASSKSLIIGEWKLEKQLNGKKVEMRSCP